MSSLRQWISTATHSKVTVAAGPFCLQLLHNMYPTAYRVLREWFIALLCSSPLKTLPGLQAAGIISILIVFPLEYLLKGQAVTYSILSCSILKHTKEECIDCAQGRAAWTSWSKFALIYLQVKNNRRTHFL